MIPIDPIAGEIDRDPAGRMQVRGLGISLGVGLQQHGLLIEPAGSDTYDCPAVAVVVVPSVVLLPVDAHAAAAPTTAAMARLR